MKTQYCNHIKINKPCQKEDVEEAVKNGFTLSAEAEFAFNQGSRKRLPFLIYSTLKPKNDEEKLHELNPGQKADQVSI